MNRVTGEMEVIIVNFELLSMSLKKILLNNKFL